MAGMLRVSRSRGALSGMLLILLGAWGGLIPFIGPSFHYAYTPDTSWTYTSGRLWLEILPAAGALVGGFIVLVSGLRPTALFGAWVAAISGAWFVLGGVFAPLWTTTAPAGVPVGSSTMTRLIEQIGFFGGLGVVMVFVAALALGRLTVIAARDVARASGPAVVSPPPAAASEAERIEAHLPS